jgi:hypothetical protein
LSGDVVQPVAVDAPTFGSQLNGELGGIPVWAWLLGGLALAAIIARKGK